MQIDCFTDTSERCRWYPAQQIRGSTKGEHTMQTATVNDTTLAYERHGEGEPVMLLHPGFVANAFAPLMREPSLAGRQLIAYQRRGYGASASVQAPFEIPQHASDCLALMDHLGITRAHLVGHSFGA